METHKPKTATINDFREWNDREGYGARKLDHISLILY